MLTPTLTQYLVRELSAHPDMSDIIQIMSDLSVIGKHISRDVHHASLLGIRGAVGAVNVQGEDVQKLDVVANELCKTYLTETGHFAAMASEEEEHVIDTGSMGEKARYVIAFDPLDGSSNIDVNITIGTIFSILRRIKDIERTDERHFLQKGSQQVCAGYFLYGAGTVLVFSFGNGVVEFTLDQTLGEFLLTHERMMMPEDGMIYSVNESNTKFFLEKDRKFVEYLKNRAGAQARYVGSLVADFHRTLKKGGIFLYPATDKKGTGDYCGRERLNYEVKPMAFLAQQAGGLATDGNFPISEIAPESLHQRIPVVLGSKKIVEEYLAFKP